MARPSLLIFPAARLAAGRNWHLPHQGLNSLSCGFVWQEGCRDFNGPFPQSLWMSSMAIRAPQLAAGAARKAFVMTTVDSDAAGDCPAVRRQRVVPKTVTEAPAADHWLSARRDARQYRSFR